MAFGGKVVQQLDEKHKEMKQVGPGPETRRPEGRSIVGRLKAEAKRAHGRGLLSSTVDPNKAGPLASHERDQDRCHASLAMADDLGRPR